VKEDRRCLFQDIVPCIRWRSWRENVKTSTTETSYTAEIKNWLLINKSKELPLHDYARFRVEYLKKNEKTEGVVVDT
jgi:hypothetical protein